MQPSTVSSDIRSIPHSATFVRPEILTLLDRLRRRIRLFIALDGFLLLLLLSVCIFWIGLAVDYGLFSLFLFDLVQELPRSDRIRLVGGGFLLIVFFVFLSIVSQFVREYRLESLALLLEDRFPDLLKNRLITAIELADSANISNRYNFSKAMIDKTISDVATDACKISIGNVLNWKRIRTKCFLLIFLLILGIGIFFGIVQLANRSLSFYALSWRVRHLTSQWIERNILFLDEPWQRRSHFDVLDFPPNLQRHILNDSGGRTTIRVRVAQWVISDPASPSGWRPLLWRDLPSLGLRTEIVGVPDQAFSDIESGVPFRESLAALTGPIHPLLTVQPRPGIPYRNRPSDRPWSVDEIESILADSVTVQYLRFRLNHREEQYVENLQMILNELINRANDPAEWRSLRRFSNVDNIQFSYRGRKTEGLPESMKRMGPFEFVTELKDLQENVSVRIRHENFSRSGFRLILENRPVLITDGFQRTEYYPAFMIHFPPANTDPSILRGKLQMMLTRVGVSLAQERPSIQIPQGGAVDLYFVSDKPLSKVTLIPEVGKDDPPPDLSPITFTAETATGFTEFSFSLRGSTRINRSHRFVLEMTDQFGIVGRRPLEVLVGEDKLPSAALRVEGIRVRRDPTGEFLVCTPKAYLPFNAESSFITDDIALTNVDYLVDLSLRGTTTFRVLGLDVPAPIANRFPDSPPRRSFPLKSFVDEFARSRTAWQTQTGIRTVADLDQFLAKPFESFGRIPYVRQIDFTKDYYPTLDSEPNRPVREHFSLRAAVPGPFRDAIDTGAARGVLVLNVRCRDGNEEMLPSGSSWGIRLALDLVQSSGKFSRSVRLERPLRILIVSERELLEEIDKDQSMAINKFKSLVVSVENFDRSFTQTLATLRDAQTPESLQSDPKFFEVSRAFLDLMQTKRNETQRILDDFSTIFREYKLNDVEQKWIENQNNRVVQPLTEILFGRKIDGQSVPGEFDAAITAYRELHQQIEVLQSNNAGSVPPELRTSAHALVVGKNPIAIEKSRQSIQALIRRLQEIQSQIGIAKGFADVLLATKELIKEQSDQKKLLDQILAQSDLLGLALKATDTKIAVGSVATIRVTLEGAAEIPPGYAAKLQIPSDSGLQIAKQPNFVDNDDFSGFLFDLKAGDKKGTFYVKLIPTKGSPVIIKVTVE